MIDTPPVFHSGCDSQQSARKGAVVVLVAVLLVVLLGCVALAVDIGYLYVARAELQRAADAGAMAGAQALGRDSDNPFDEFIYLWDIYNQAKSSAEANTCAGSAVRITQLSDVKIGYLEDPRDLTANLQTVPLDQCNAVQVTARRTASSQGGAIGLFFAPIFGISSSNVAATAIAAIDDRFYAYSPVSIGGIGAIPFAVDEQEWTDSIINGNGDDKYSYDPQSGNVLVSQDGVREIKLFPDKVKGKGKGNSGAGNFGILHVGSGSLGVPTIREQIRNGISQDDLVDATGKPMMDFYDDESGAEVSHDILGNPGIKAGLEDALAEKLGQKVGFFLYRSVSGTGANTSFEIVGMRFGRVMLVDLAGGDKAVIVQPVPHYGPDILTSPNAPSTNRLMGSLELVR